MVRLTLEIIEQSAQRTNPVRDRELDLRGYNIPVIENLGGTLDQFDTLDLSDNEIRKVDGFPLLKRLKQLLLNNNRVVRIEARLNESLPNIESLILTNNNVKELGDLDNLTCLKNLRVLSLLGNPVTTKRHYRLYLAHHVPQLKLIDFRKVKLKEREEAARLFKGKKGHQLAKEIGKRTKTFVPGAALADKKGDKEGPTTNGIAKANHDIEQIKTAIANAQTLEEVERLNQLLQAGQIPGKVEPPKTEAVEEMET